MSCKVEDGDTWFSIQAEHDDGVTKMLFNPFDGIQKILLYFLTDCENAASKIQMK